MPWSSWRVRNTMDMELLIKHSGRQKCRKTKVFNFTKDAIRCNHLETPGAHKHSEWSSSAWPAAHQTAPESKNRRFPTLICFQTMERRFLCQRPQPHKSVLQWVTGPGKCQHGSKLRRKKTYCTTARRTTI